MIDLKNVSKIYRTDGVKKVVLNNISFSFPTDVSIALMGANGAGKSCLLKIVSGLIEPTYGSVSRSCSVSWPVGFAGSFHRDLTGAQNARFVARLYGEPSDKLLEFVKDFSELGDDLQKPVRVYSSGMRSRLAFAISMGIKFDYYLIDEVTSVGDANFRKKSSDFLLNKMDSQGALVVSHSNEMLRKLCRSGVVLEKSNLYYFQELDAAIDYYDWTRTRKPTQFVALEGKEKRHVDYLLSLYPRITDAKKPQVAYTLSLLARDPRYMHLVVPRTDFAVSGPAMRHLVANEKWDSAEQLAHMLVHKDPPGAALSLQILSNELFKQGRDKRWLRYARAAVKAKGANSVTNLFLARRLLISLGRPSPEVRQCIEDALAKDPESARAYWLRARVDLHDGSVAEARAAIAKALSIEPGNADFIDVKRQIDAAA